MAAMQRALTRAGLRLNYSEGFNPHPYISVALPLPVGCGSYCELVDIGFAEAIPAGDIAGRTNSALPEGIEIKEAYEPVRKFNEISWLEISAALTYDNGGPPDARELLTECFSSEQIVVSKKTKRGVSELDVAPYIKSVTFTGENPIIMSGRFSAQNPSINPENIKCILGGCGGSIKPDFTAFSRQEIFDKDFIVFR